jgi:serine/threonine-protein kinase
LSGRNRETAKTAHCYPHKTVQLKEGDRLGPYEIVSFIGAGGMGEVYGARDSRLQRTVAIKVLPAHHSDRADARQRFEREARAISSLNHPHICTVYDIGEIDGAAYLVMEFLEGETLGDRMTRGPIPPQQVLRFGAEICDALDGAHRQHITHRDLKPGNIMITKSGIKLLDFGLAKLRNLESEGAFSGDSPTAQLPLTEEGAVLGTLQYMAPEQLEGKEADVRTDIFAAGVVLYEMAAGRRPFIGVTQAAIAASILHSDPPPIVSLQPLSPPGLERIVRPCLAKDPEERWQTARDIALQLKALATGSEQSVVAQSMRRRRRWLIPAVVGVSSAILAVALLMLFRPKSPEPASYHLSLNLPNTQTLYMGRLCSPMALSADGARVAYSASLEDGIRIFLRDLRSGEMTALAGTEDGTDPFFKPDGTALGFIANSRLKTLSINGGGVRDIGPANGPGQGGTWLDDGSIVFVGQPNGAMERIWPDSGKRETITKVGAGDSGHLSPQALPDGRHVLFTSLVDGKSRDDSRIEVIDLQTKIRRVIYEGGTHARYIPGRIFFVHSDRLFSIAFDLDKLATEGAPKEILQPVLADLKTGAGFYEIARNGTIVYVSHRAAILNRHMVWAGRTGRVEALRSDPRWSCWAPRVSPNGKKLVVMGEGGNPDLWVCDLTRGIFSRLTFAANNIVPLWSADSQSVIFSRTYGSGLPVLMVLKADGSGQPGKLLDSPNATLASSLSADGRWLATYEFTPKGMNAGVYSLAGDATLRWKAASPFDESMPTLSPDGRWVAYQSNESGQSEIYVQSTEGAGEKTLISAGGGVEPLWSHSGREIFYRSGNRLMSVAVSAAGGFSTSTARVLFEHPFEFGEVVRNYDVTPDDQRFVFIEATSEEHQIRVIDVIVGRPPML